MSKFSRLSKFKVAYLFDHKKGVNHHYNHKCFPNNHFESLFKHLRYPQRANGNALGLIWPGAHLGAGGVSSGGQFLGIYPIYWIDINIHAFFFTQVEKSVYACTPGCPYKCAAASTVTGSVAAILRDINQNLNRTFKAHWTKVGRCFRKPSTTLTLLKNNTFSIFNITSFVDFFFLVVKRRFFVKWVFWRGWETKKVNSN